MALFTGIGAALGASTAVAAGATTSAAFATGVGVTALAGAAAGYSMYSSDQQMKMGKMAASQRDALQMPKAPMAPSFQDAAKIAQQQAEDKRRSMARSTSVMTNPLGIKDEAEIVKKKVLGG
jgi:hypothetical protein